MVKKIRLTKEEQWIEDHMNEFIPVSKEKFEEIAAALKAYRKDAVLNIRINQNDLALLKLKAQKLGVPYQTMIGEFLHRLAQS